MNKDLNLHVNITIRGKVNKVGFRFLAMQNAIKIGIAGFVMNAGIGKLIIEAEGSQENIQKFVKWCKIGPPHSSISQISINKAPLKNFTTFDILP